MIETVKSWFTHLWPFMLIIGTGLGVGLSYWLDPDAPPPPGAEGRGFPCLQSCAPHCLPVEDGESVGCLLKCGVYCLGWKDEEVTVTMAEDEETSDGASETQIESITYSGTGAGTGSEGENE